MDVPQTRRPPKGRPREDGKKLNFLDVVDGELSGATILGGVEGDLLTLCQTSQTGSLERGGVNENVLGAIVRLDESKALLIVVELHSTGMHELSSA
jgi:hypothetical protein